jgi:hypothetical protein
MCIRRFATRSSTYVLVRSKRLCRGPLSINHQRAGHLQVIIRAAGTVCETAASTKAPKAVAACPAHLRAPVLCLCLVGVSSAHALAHTQREAQVHYPIPTLHAGKSQAQFSDDFRSPPLCRPGGCDVRLYVPPRAMPPPPLPSSLSIIHRRPLPCCCGPSLAAPGVQRLGSTQLRDDALSPQKA